MPGFNPSFTHIVFNLDDFLAGSGLVSGKAFVSRSDPEFSSLGVLLGEDIWEARGFQSVPGSSSSACCC
jgi:hypothetical protein